MWSRNNSAKINSNVLQLGDRHNAIVRNMMKARLRMSDAIWHLKGRYTTVTVAKGNTSYNGPFMQTSVSKMTETQVLLQGHFCRL